MLHLWNVSVFNNSDTQPEIVQYQFYASNINGAIKQGEEFGVVVKAVMSALERK